MFGLLRNAKVLLRGMGLCGARKVRYFPLSRTKKNRVSSSSLEKIGMRNTNKYKLLSGTGSRGTGGI